MKTISFVVTSVLSVRHCTHIKMPQNDLFSLHNATLHFGSWSKDAVACIGCSTEACDAGVEIASRVKGALQSSVGGGGGPSPTLTRPGNAEGAGWRDGRMEEEEVEGGTA